MNHIEYTITGAALAALLIIAGHYFNWPRPLSMNEARIYGVLTIVIGFTVRGRFEFAEWEGPLTLAIVTASAGAATIACHGWDALMLSYRQARRAEATDEDLRG